MKRGLAGEGFIETHGSCKSSDRFGMQKFRQIQNAKVQTDSEDMMTVSVNYPHALHSRHRPERPEGPQGSHCPERLDPSSSKEGGCEVDQRDLRLLVLLVFIFLRLLVLLVFVIIHVSVMVLVRHVSGGSGRTVNS